MAKQKYIIAHCLETPPNLSINREQLKVWHMGPKDLENNKVKYLGKVYNNRDELPVHEIDGRSINAMHGNGWDRLGYSVLFHRNGKHDIITPYDDDDFIEANEMTWGCAGINAVSRHFGLAGGLGAKRDDDFFDHFTDEQFLAVKDWLKVELAKHPDVLVGGHNDFTNGKDCPGFQVYDLMDLYGMKQYAYQR